MGAQYAAETWPEGTVPFNELLRILADGAG